MRATLSRGGTKSLRFETVPLTDDDYDQLFSLLVRIFQNAQARGTPDGGVFRRLMSDHLGVDPVGLPIVSDTYAPFEHPNLQLALEAYLDADDRSAELIGVLGGMRQFMGFGLRNLVEGHALTELRVGPVEYETKPTGVEATMPCVALGLYLVKDPEGPHVIFVHGEQPMGRRDPGLVVDVTAPRAEHALSVLAQLRQLARARNIYRGQMITVSEHPNPFGPRTSLGVTFHRRPTVTREQIVLPEAVLGRVERHVLGIGRSASSLLAAGRHVRRGLLLHGPPGTGKTLSVRYLAARLSGATVIVLSGTSMGAIETSCAMARELAPALVVLEDVDLIAQERSLPGAHGQPLLFQLMNEIDGITEDADVAFVLTTNRAELLEPALAARPGRVDLAVGLELPDAEARRQLINLYGQGLSLHVDDWTSLLERTEGTSPAFIKEWLRAAVLRHDPPRAELSEPDLDEALSELLDDTNRLTRVLLGGAAEQALGAGMPFPLPGGPPPRLAWLPGVEQALLADPAGGPGRLPLGDTGATTPREGSQPGPSPSP